MIAKLISYGKDRNEAIERMKRAIREYKISGVKTTLPFCDFVLRHPKFLDGSFTTKFVETHFEPQVLQEEITEDQAVAIAIVAYELANVELLNIPNQKRAGSKWKSRLNIINGRN